MSGLTHQDDEGRVRMVDVGDKPVTARRAVASARVFMNADAFAAIRDGAGPKGDALKTAELAGIMAAKRTADLIPLCHPLPLTRAKVVIEPDAAEGAFVIRAEVATDGRTGVEMEALTAASVAALTLYDMAKALDRTIRITNVQLEEKSGGRSGDYRRDADNPAA
jgi:cyclic pyranopterin phosphate synthase